VIVKLVCLFLSLFLASPLLAQGEVAEEAVGPWSGKATLGYLATSGNTENSSLNSGFEVAYTSGKWEHMLNMRAINSSESEQTTAEFYEAAWKTEYNFSENNFMFGRANWRKDRFSGYKTQMSQTAGYGRRIFDTGAHTLSVEVGAGARQSELQDGMSEDDLILRGGLDYKWVFSETADFSQIFVVEAGDINTYIESVSALRAQLVGTLALVASYTVRNNSDVPIGTEETDTFTALSLEYVF
jgi:putative salt-induced outer membrane protein